MPGEPLSPPTRVLHREAAFHLLLVVFFVYWKIYKAAKLSEPGDQQRLTHIRNRAGWVLGSLKKHFACVCTGLFSGTPLHVSESGKF